MYIDVVIIPEFVIKEIVSDYRQITWKRSATWKENDFVDLKFC